MVTPIVFLGDSHAQALIKALRKMEAADMVAVDVRRISGVPGNSKEIRPSLAADYPAEAVYCCFGGTEYNLIGMMESTERFDFLETPEGPFDEARKLVPSGLIRKALDHRLRSALGRMEQARALYDCPFTCVAPPPPFADLDDDAVLPTAFQRFLDRGITPAPIRHKLYRLQTEMVREHCRLAGIGFISAPPATVDDEGYLLRSCWDRDPTHGNARYGAAVIEQIRKVELAHEPSL